MEGVPEEAEGGGRVLQARSRRIVHRGESYQDAAAGIGHGVARMEHDAGKARHVLEVGHFPSEVAAPLEADPVAALGDGCLPGYLPFPLPVDAVRLERLTLPEGMSFDAQGPERVPRAPMRTG